MLFLTSLVSHMQYTFTYTSTYSCACLASVVYFTCNFRKCSFRVNIAATKEKNKAYQRSLKVLLCSDTNVSGYRSKLEESFTHWNQFQGLLVYVYI